MLNEHERNEGPEDGEYHFSDESGYDTNHEEEAKAPEISEQSNLAAKFSSYRRFVIIGGAFAVVLLITYLIIPPLATTPSTEITAVSAPPSTPVEVPVQVATTPKPVAVPVAKPAAETKLTKEAPKSIQAEAPVAPKSSSLANLIEAEKEKLMAEKAAVMSKIKSQETKSQESPSTAPSTVITVPPTEAALPAAVPTIGSQDFINEPVSTLISSSQQQVQATAETKATIDRLTAMQEANTKALGQMQAQYTQKIADYEVQNKALRDQVQTLTTQLGSMEVQINKLVQTLNRQQQQMSPSPPPPGEAAVNSMSENGPNLQNPPILVNAQPGFKSGYSVQAIIPGRAWLRAESGETITIAEGDVLKSLGKVTKIDPYDGTIQVDTGNRVITLTYGSGEYS